jgi:DNA-binding response OmpR family regulator
MPERVIVIIDDEPSLLHIVTTYLGMRGYQAYGAGSGADGLKLIEEKKPDLVILDMMLPEMSGTDICRALREAPATAHLPILMLTARADPATVVQAERAGANAYLAKPVMLQRLLEEMEKLLVP